MMGRPAHGGYPTPTYDEAPMLRRSESQRIFGHTGASVYSAVTNALGEAATTERLDVVVTPEQGEASDGHASPDSGGDA